LITAAQAFHWFDEEKFKKEAMRILRPGGKVAIIWNTSLDNDFTSERNCICRKYCPRFQRGYAGKRSPAEGDDFLRHNYFREVEVVAFDNPFVMDLECFEGNMRSRSYALLPGERAYKSFRDELRELFERHAVNGRVVEPQETQVFLGSF
jgi:SAM-dependent methyltransferase